MDSIGDYIYLIILALAGLSGLFKKKKETGASTPTSSKKSWEDVLRDLVPIEEELNIEPEVVPNVVSTVPPITYQSYETAPDPLVLRAKKPVSNMVSAKNPIVTERKIDTTNSSQTEFNFSTLDDAKRAFVYSEIFNRKY